MDIENLNNEENTINETEKAENSSEAEVVTNETASQPEAVNKIFYQSEAPKAPASYVSEPTPRHEYVYNEPPRQKNGKGGIIALSIIAGLLGVFAVSIISISAFVAVTGFSFDVKTEQNEQIFTPNDKPNLSTTVTTSPESEEPEVTTTRDYPTLEQLASPEDALGLPEIYEKVSPSVVGVSCTTVYNGSATGTGIIMSADGYILTNAHVVDDAKEIKIVDKDFNEYEATLIGLDSETDLAVLKIEAEDLPACEFGKSGDVRIGELAIAIGNPLGFELYGSMSTGIISGLNRKITIGDNTMTLLQTTASINRGNSGGPLINAYGQVIGVTSAKVDSSYGEGLGFAIPIDSAFPIIEDLVKHGYVTGRPMIGISGEDISSVVAKYYGLPRGVMVRYVTPDSGAAKAGIASGDIIIGAEGETITTMDELNSIKSRFAAGDTITLTVYRNGKSYDVEVLMTEVTKESN